MIQRVVVFVVFLSSLGARPFVESFVAYSSAQGDKNARGSNPLPATASYLETLSSTTAPSACYYPSQINPRYPSYAFDNYLENPYFQQINTLYPGLQLIHQEPYIFIINNFLTADECARLRAKADEGILRPQVGGGAVERTSSGVVCVPDEVPTIQQKMMHLTNIHDPDQLQYLKVSKYQQGQTFSKHTDAWPTEGAPISRGWVHEADFFGDERRRAVGCLPALEQPNQNTILTSFVYLNDVAEGGCMAFPNIGIHTGRNGNNFYTHPAPMDSRWRQSHHDDATPVAWDWDYRTTLEPLRIQPEQGMAVLHLCSLLPEYGGITDGNTFHVAEPPAPGNEKYVAQQFVSSCKEWILPEDSMPHGRVTWDTI